MKKIITLVLAACMMLTSFCALAESDKYTIVVMPKQVGITYFESARAGVVKAGEELGVNAVFTGPTVADAAEQVKMIQDLISQGVNADCSFCERRGCADPGSDAGPKRRHRHSRLGYPG